MEAFLLNLPSPIRKHFKNYFDYVRSLKFDAEPEYSYLRGVFCNLFTEYRFQKDYSLDWIIHQNKPTKNNDIEDEGMSASCNGTMVLGPQQAEDHTYVVL